MFDIYAYIRKDHRVITDLMDQIVDTHLLDARQRLFSRFREAVERHAQAEELSFYAALNATEDAELHKQESQSEEEHGEISRFFEFLEEADPATDRWFVLFGQLKQALAQHFRREENEVFAQAQRLISGRKACDLATRMELLKQRHIDSGREKRMAADLDFIHRLFN